jgi:hypothetical protein
MARKKGEITLLEMQADALEVLSEGVELSDDMTAAYEATDDAETALVFYGYDGEELMRLTAKEAHNLNSWLSTNTPSVWALAQEG